MLKLETDYAIVDSLAVPTNDLDAHDTTLGLRLLADTPPVKLEEIRDITWGFAGAQLYPWQAAQRLYKAGFVDAKLLAVAWAVMEAESGGYLKAFHHNVRRNPDGTILRNGNQMTVVSTDLGFIQRNVFHSGGRQIEISAAASAAFLEALFDDNPELADGQASAEIAHDLFVDRGWQPWVAHRNLSYKRSLPRGGEAVGNYLGASLLNNHNLVRRIDA
jgi:hypothetical protein